MTTLPQTALAKPSRGSAAGLRAAILYLAMAALIAGTGMVMGWNYALTAINMGLISAILALGLNLQWGYAGLFNVGIMGFVALGGLAAVLVSMRPVGEAWASGGLQVVAGLVLGVLTVLALVAIRRRVPAGTMKTLFLIAAAVLGVVITRAVLNPGVTAVEAVSPASTRIPRPAPLPRGSTRRTGAPTTTCGATRACRWRTRRPFPSGQVSGPASSPSRAAK